MKPPGIEMVLRDGKLCMGVTPTNRVADKIWEAAEEAFDAGWEPERIKGEFAEAYEHYSKKAHDRNVKEIWK